LVISIFQAAFCLPLGLLRLIFLCLVLPLTILLDTVASFVPLWFIQRLLKRLIVAPLCRLILFLLGYIYISEKVPDPRRLRLARLKKGSQIPGFGSSVKSGDVIFCNSTSIVEVIYLAYRFSTDFAAVALPEGDKVITHNLWSGLRRVGAPFEEKKVRKSAGNRVTLAAAASRALANGAPLAFFPEAVRSNGVAVLNFTPAAETAKGNGVRKHILAFKYHYKKWSPCHTVGGLRSYVFASCFQLYNTMEVSMVPHELRLISYNGKTQKDLNSQSDSESLSESEHLRSLLAMAIGERGAKLVNLGSSEYFAFLDYMTAANMKRKHR